MIQRVQSLFIAFSAIISFVAAGFFYLTSDPFVIGFDLKCVIFIVLFLNGILSVASLFLFKKRKIQILANKIVILLNALLIALLFYSLFILPGESIDSEKGILGFFLFLVLFSSVFANRYIKKDEQLVKSIDRIR